MPRAPLRSSSMALRSSRVRQLLERRSYGDVDVELGSVALSRMIVNFMEGSDQLNPRSVVADNNSSITVQILKELVCCIDEWERKLLEETRKLVGSGKMGGDHEKGVRIRDGLWSLGFEASVCASKWDQTPRHPPGQHEYIDVIIDDPYPSTPAAQENRIIIDVDFRSEFEVARSTRHYASLLRALPEVFVGRPGRLRRVVTIVSDAAVKSLRRNGMHVPPWRRTEYMLCKWFSPFVRRGRVGQPTWVSPLPVSPDMQFLLDYQMRKGKEEDEGEEGGDNEEEGEDKEEEEGEWRTMAFAQRTRGRKVAAGLTRALS